MFVSLIYRMKKYNIIIIFILIIMIIISVIVVGVKIGGKKSASFEIIIVTNSKMTIYGVKEIIIANLKTSDLRIKVNVRESSDKVVTLDNNFVSTLSTILNKNKIINILSKSKKFKCVQPNYIFKAQN